MTASMLAIPAIPLCIALALVAPIRSLRRVMMDLTPFAALPAVLLALWPADMSPRPMPGLLLESWFGLDTVSRVFLLLTSLLWTIAGWYARTYLAADRRRMRYLVFHLLALAGNLGLCVAHDVATFYLAFAMMTFAAYGLVVHTQTAGARRAGRVYVVMAVAGEMLLLAGVMIAASGSPSLELSTTARAVASSPERNIIVGLILAGFGIKAGALPLHVWLPLAHPIAPTPASAVLSGSMIKAGLLGWLRFLPLGLVDLPGWGTAVIALGLAAAFAGAALGVVQRDAKTTLAYSSISQMGIINIGVGIGLVSSEAWPVALAACLAYAMHHGLAKGALFLGIGVADAATGPRERRFALAGIAFAGMAVAGAPLTSGSVAKSALKAAAPMAPGAWPGALDLLLPLATVGSTLLMARVLWLAAAKPQAEGSSYQGGSLRTMGLWAPWIVLLGTVGTVVWFAPGYYELDVHRPELTPRTVWVGIWPVIVGAVAAWLALMATRRGRFDPDRVAIAPGDVLIPIERFITALGARVRLTDQPMQATPMVSLGSAWYGLQATPGSTRLLRRAEEMLVKWRTAAALVVVIALILGSILVAS